MKVEISLYKKGDDGCNQFTDVIIDGDLEITDRVLTAIINGMDGVKIE